ncbi:hypothetical protein NFI96_026064 [Prochilodus magdalenae]|nr:hypothetical protein NFI96_026064 [Prochilodus magdalenae]
MDNLFLVRDVIDLCGMDSLDIGLLTLDQEKAFDRVDHVYLFKTLQAFGFKSGFISWLSILYSEASFLLKVGVDLGPASSCHYRGRVLVANNLVDLYAVVGTPSWLSWSLQPHSFRDIQMRGSLKLFWSGQHWIPAPALYLPLQEGGQGPHRSVEPVENFPPADSTGGSSMGRVEPVVDTACVLLPRAWRGWTVISTSLWPAPGTR